MPSLCESCGERPAILFITQIVDEESRHVRLCEECVRERAQHDEMMGEILEQMEAELQGNTNGVEAADVPTSMFQELVEEIFEELDAEWQEESEGEFEGEMDGEWLEIVQGEDANLEPLPPVLRPAERVTRCSRCGTTWDRIRHDGRVGCAYCYTTFREQLGEVMERVQRGMEHTGKQPRTALKRERRLQHLRKRRDNQLAMLQNRLRDAVAAENYEEAALLRDKIRAASTSQHD